MRRTLWLYPLWAAVSLASAQAQTAPPAAVTPLTYYPVQAPQAGRWSQQNAQVEAVRDAQLAAQVAGAVVQLKVQAGDVVQAGQALLHIDARMAQQGAAASTAQVVAAQAQLEVASKELERQKQLFAKRYISQAALDNAQAQWRASAAQVQALQAQAGVAATQSGLHVLRAPFAGIVASVPTVVGDMALPGKPLLTLYDPQALRITTAVSQEQAQQLRHSPQLQVDIPGVWPQPQAVQPAQLEILPTADAMTHTVPVRVLLSAAQGAIAGAAAGAANAPLTPGMFARLLWHNPGAATAPGDATAGSVWVPQHTVLRRAELTAVYVQGSNGQPLLRQVRVGPVQGDMVEILSGLAPGEQVAEQPHRAAKVR